jgi:hypothetical protein
MTMPRYLFLPILALGLCSVAQAQQYGQEQPQKQTDPAGQQTGTVQMMNVFSIQGLPNDSGQLDWPFAYSVMPRSDEVRALQSRINAQFLAVMIQRTGQGQSDPALLKELRRSLSDLRVRVNESRGLLAHGTYVEGRDFYRKLVAAEKMLQ